MAATNKFTLTKFQFLGIITTEYLKNFMLKFKITDIDKNTCKNNEKLKRKWIQSEVAV